MNHEHVPTGAEPADRRRVPVTGTLLDWHTPRTGRETEKATCPKESTRTNNIVKV